MIAQIPPEVLQAIPPKYLVYALAGWVILKDAGRAYYAIRNGGGLLSIWRGLIYGTNTPKQSPPEPQPQPAQQGSNDSMKKIVSLIAILGLLAGFTAAKAQTNPPASSIPLLDVLGTGSNWFAVPFGTVAQGGKSFGGGIALGYQATAALAPVVRLDEFAGKAYLGNLSLQLSVPRSLMGKVPIVPFALAGAGIPLSSATIDGNLTLSAGNPVGIVGIGAYVPLDFLSSSWFFQNSFLVADYEHWAGANFPATQANQFRFGFGIKF